MKAKDDGIDFLRAEVSTLRILLQKQRKQIDCGARGHVMTYRGEMGHWGQACERFECVKCEASYHVGGGTLNDHEQALVDIVRQQETL